MAIEFWEAYMKTSAPLNKNSIYYIQSMTKPLISVAIMQLVEKGMIALEDPVHMYIPEVKNLGITTDLELGIDAPTRAPKKNNHP
jgi:CubicO group peptidase (beta-lactamase class C family)|tara:strand:- start:37 stop:291 length:255 start_codon:yes stop_codon:yes gene_type:complete